MIEYQSPAGVIRDRITISHCVHIEASQEENIDTGGFRGDFPRAGLLQVVEEPLIGITSIWIEHSAEVCSLKYCRVFNI